MGWLAPPCWEEAWVKSLRHWRDVTWVPWAVCGVRWVGVRIKAVDRNEVFGMLSIKMIRESKRLSPSLDVLMEGRGDLRGGSVAETMDDQAVRRWWQNEEGPRLGCVGGSKLTLVVGKSNKPRCKTRSSLNPARQLSAIPH